MNCKKCNTCCNCKSNITVNKPVDVKVGGAGNDGLNAYELAVLDGFVGTYEEWKESQKGEDGDDGLTPYIGSNGNWWVGDTDTGVPAQGEYDIPSPETDEDIFN